MAKPILPGAEEAHSASHHSTLPPGLRPILEPVYSAVAMCCEHMTSQAADRDIDAARVLRRCALNPLGDLLWNDSVTTNENAANDTEAELADEAELTDPEKLQEEIEAERGAIFRAMNLVSVVADLHKAEEDYDRWGTLQMAYDHLDKIASRLEGIHGRRQGGAA